MSDFEMLSVMLLFNSVIVAILLEYIKNNRLRSSVRGHFRVPANRFQRFTFLPLLYAKGAKKARGREKFYPPSPGLRKNQSWKGSEKLDPKSKPREGKQIESKSLRIYYRAFVGLLVSLYKTHRG